MNAKIIPQDNIVENEMYIPFRKPYLFEGEEHTGVDLSGLDDLSTDDLIRVERINRKGGNVMPLQEMTLEYACLIAAQASHLPVEFFKGLPPKVGVKVKNMVTSFLFSEE